ncbi:MAG: tricarballylate utilization 4Fe-4S protein TcuB [Pseudolabrys sp.]
MLTTENLREAERLMTICNACRYCEGLCAVFPAMEMRFTFGAGDLNYLANLCHQCGACYPDCQYSPPHEFNVNVPAALAKLRNDSYAHYAWPRALSGAFARNGLIVTLLAAVSTAAFILGFVALGDPAALYARNAGDFYNVMPHNWMAGLFSAVALYVIAAFWFSLRAFWRDINGDAPRAGFAAFGRAIADTMHLTYMHGGGGGCTSEDDAPSPARRIFHHLTFYGFLLCFAATCVATLYHYAFGWHAPYALWSLPVLLGIVGGIGLLIGPAGLFVLARKRDPVLVDRARRGMDTAFIAMLFLVSLTGFLLMILRDTGAMGMLLAIHLGVVLGLFLSLPYGKFVHGLYRFLALVKYASERRHGKFVE